MPAYPRPTYCATTFDERGGGFHFSAAPPKDVWDTKYLHDADPWRVLASALARLQRGDFGVFERLAAMLSAVDDLDIRLSGCTLFTFAAPRSALAWLRPLYEDAAMQKAPELARQYCKVLCHSGHPDHLRAALDVYRRTPDPEVRVLVAEYLSHALEANPGPIATGVTVTVDEELPPAFREEYPDYDSYAATVERTLEQAIKQDRSTNALHAGRPLDIDRLVSDLLTHAHEGEDSMRTNYERMTFEAITGVPCYRWFSDEPTPRLLPLQLAAGIEAYREENRPALVVGQRYFFGRLIPA